MLMEMQLVRKLTSLYNVIMLAYHLLLFKGTENWFVKKMITSHIFTCILFDSLICTQLKLY